MAKTVIKIADQVYGLNLINSRTWTYFKGFRIKDTSFEVNQTINLIPPVQICELESEEKRLKDAAFAEYSLLFEAASNIVLPLNCFFYHGAAFLWRESAFLFTGPSGIGKTTQLLNWLKLYPDEVEVINGDKPLIVLDHGNLIVHPSPWGGKEGFNGKRCCALKGIILLEQGDCDRINRITVNEAVYPLFLQFLYKPVNERDLDYICNYETAILSNIPVWKLINRGTEESAKLTHNFLEHEAFI